MGKILIIAFLLTACTITRPQEYEMAAVRMHKVTVHLRMIDGEWKNLYEIEWLSNDKAIITTYEFDTTGMQPGMIFPAFIKK